MNRWVEIADEIAWSHPYRFFIMKCEKQSLPKNLPIKFLKARITAKGLAVTAQVRQNVNNEFL